jgi:hypothetical protein
MKRHGLLPIHVVALLLAVVLPVTVVLADEMDYEVCVKRWEQELNVFRSVVYVSLALTIMNIIISLLILKKHFVRNPRLGYRYYFCLASIKLLLGMSLLTVLWPSCPYGCGERGGGSFCNVNSHYYLYPYIVMAIGLTWMFRGYKYYRIHQVQASSLSSSSTTTTNHHHVDKDWERQEGDETTTAVMALDHPKDKNSKVSTASNEGIV